MSDSGSWLEDVHGMTAQSGDAARLRHHWQADSALLDRAMAIYAGRTRAPFFDCPAAAFDRMVRA